MFEWNVGITITVIPRMLLVILKAEHQSISLCFSFSQSKSIEVLDECNFFSLFLLQGLFWLPAIVPVLHFCPHAWCMSVPLIASVGRSRVLHVATQLLALQKIL